MTPNIDCWLLAGRAVRSLAHRMMTIVASARSASSSGNFCLSAGAAGGGGGTGSAYSARDPVDGYVYPDYIAPGSVYAGAPTSPSYSDLARRSTMTLGDTLVDSS